MSDQQIVGDYAVVTLSRRERFPRVVLESFSCLGCSVEGAEVIVGRMPMGARYIDGVLGMDFIRRFPIEIYPYRCEIIVRD